MRNMFRNSSLRATKRVMQRSKNMILRGVGGETLQDRGAQNTSSQHTLHPYYNNNFMARWQEYVRWYMTSWEAQKIIDIPIQDALREPVQIEGLQQDDADRLWDAYEAYNCERQLRRALTQERLLGGSGLLPIWERPCNEETADKLDYSTLMRGDLKAFNVIDVARMSRPTYNTDPFDPDYDKISCVQVNSTVVHASRMCIFDGDPLFNRASQTTMQNYRYNPCGFGESKLATLYDLLIRVTGTQQGAYHLVNLASCLVMSVSQLRALNAVGSPAKAKLEELAEQLSIYRAGIVDAKDVEFKQHSASFGSVPELVMSFLQILSAGSDIPATRFLGQAPGGLNATGDSDLENYYNGLRSWQRVYLLPRQLKIFNWLGATLWGWNTWLAKSKDMELVYPPLWNLDAVQQSQVDSAYSTMIHSLVDIGLIDQQSGINELVARDAFKTKVQAGDFLSSEMRGGAESPFGEGSIFA